MRPTGRSIAGWSACAGRPSPNSIALRSRRRRVVVEPVRAGRPAAQDAGGAVAGGAARRHPAARGAGGRAGSSAHGGGATADSHRRSFDAYDATAAGHRRPTRHLVRPLDDIKDPDFARDWRRQADAVLTADSPRGLFEFLEIVHDVGIARLLSQFFGERPSLAVEKCTMFRMSPRNWRRWVADWHQDGAFLGDGVRTVNCWFALSRCGRDAPGMDIVPRRIERILPVGEEGCHFDWTVSPMTVERAFPGVRPWRPEFQEGDVLLFDEFAVHRTAAEEEMPNIRYAIESWFFAPSAYPDGRSTPLVV